MGCQRKPPAMSNRILGIERNIYIFVAHICPIMVWRTLRQEFRDYPAREKIARKMLALGLRVSGKKIFCGDVEVKDVSLARACGVDRRGVSATVLRINQVPLLKSVFETLQPAGPLFMDSAKALNLPVVEIEVHDPGQGGVVAQIAHLLAENKVPLRQILSQDPELFENPRLFLVFYTRPPVGVFSALSRLSVVKKMTVY